MSCAGKGYGTARQSSNEYLYSQFLSSISLTTGALLSSRKCRKYKGFYPSFTPILGSLSVTSSVSGEYKNVFVTGSNFLPNGTTTVQFGSYGFVPINYYSSFNLSFVVPLSVVPGNYKVQVVNLYNGNFSPSVNQSYPGNSNFSNSITYTIT